MYFLVVVLMVKLSSGIFQLKIRESLLVDNPKLPVVMMMKEVLEPKRLMMVNLNQSLR